ncbi:MAG: hypothetical protein WCG75_00535 [Armatimonadota bacterium]
MKIQSVIVVCVLAIVGCSKSDPAGTTNKPKVAPEVQITTQNQKSLFPFAVGNSWTFAMEVSLETPNQPRSTGNLIVQYTVTKIATEGSTVKATLDVSNNGKVQDQQVWAVDSTGIYQVSTRPTPRPDALLFEPKQPVMRFPIKNQETFIWEGKGLTPVNKKGTMKYAFKCDGNQTVDTDMGSMNALFMQTGGSFKTDEGVLGNIIINAWFSPGVGLARYRQEIITKTAKSSITMRLKSYNIKK